ncbi:ElyC/SanA/YdcF family protein [Pelagicoccus sp. SDUM812005]|uniref:SanA/YdcF family protein n=1 Tax=Pelagicoccus sp. SDUM812005 TaxID=3041257 RepID=UPI00280FB42C|nr:ElyC/SanA/YdcF family protein [Pelagicoccus sp. SDUM812005]MDQ8179691.1 ElyC/SanA/YdcF family protein [Pelagicoccus sp. SDUM812005]
MKLRKRALIPLALGAASSLLLATWTARSIVENRSAAFVADHSAELPFCKTAIVLGCSSTLSDGRTNLFFENRIAAAAALYHSGRVRKLIVSGDNSRPDYNEPLEMKKALAQRGVPLENILCDYAGFSTLDSMVRAKEVFGQKQFIVVSQEFHNKRAIFIARSKGIEAYGLNAADVAASHSSKTLLREELARVKSVLDIWILARSPKYLGPKISV